MSTINITGEGQVRLGRFTHVDDDVQAIFARPGTLTIGDYCHIGPGVKFVCSGGDVHIGDWSTLHDRCLVLSGQGATIGAHCWFGQQCVIDGSGGITLGRGVRVGMYSQLWSHVAAGEQIEGCTLIGERPVVLEDDVWLVGSCIVASGVTLGRRSVALIGSNITKSFPANTVLAGAPAAAKPNLNFYRPVTLDDKWAMLRNWLGQAATELGLDSADAGPQAVWLQPRQGGERIGFARDAARALALRTEQPGTTVCCVEDKSYNKQLNATERRVLKFLAGNKARFDALA